MLSNTRRNKISLQWLSRKLKILRKVLQKIFCLVFRFGVYNFYNFFISFKILHKSLAVVKVLHLRLSLISN